MSDKLFRMSKKSIQTGDRIITTRPHLLRRWGAIVTAPTGTPGVVVRTGSLSPTILVRLDGEYGEVWTARLNVMLDKSETNR